MVIMLNQRAAKAFAEVSTHQKAAWWVRAIMQWHSQCVGWSGFLDGFDCFDGWQPKGSGKFIPIEASGGPGLKLLLIGPRSQPVDKGFGSATDMALQSGFVLFLGSSAFPIVHLRFHGQRQIYQVRRQPPCSGSFAWLGSYPGLVNRTVTPVEVVKARCNNSSSKLCFSFGPLTKYLYSKGSCTRITTLGQPTASKV